jgi:hypothetical protein
MKNFYYLLLLGFILFASSTSFSQNKNITTSNIPDLDGRFCNSPNKVMATNTNMLYNPASFALFSNFPVAASYLVFSPKTGAAVCNLDSDPALEILYGSGSKLYAVNSDTSSITGFPKTYTTNWEAVYSPSYGDIDGDGQAEIVTTIGGSLGGKIYAYHLDGTDVTGFPITTGKYPMIPVLSDIDGDGKMEIIIGDRNYKAYVYRGDGTVQPGWPKMMDRYVASSCAVGDVNNDGYKELFFESRSKLHGFDRNGNILPGFPFTLQDTVNGSNSYAAPALVDLDKDGNKEIVFCAHDAGGVVYVLKNDGTLYPGWPKHTTNWIYGSPSIADLDNDGYMDIIAAEYGASSTPEFYIYAYKKDGTNVAGFPKGPFYGIANQVTVADLDNDNQLDLLFDQNIQFGDSGIYNAIKLDGSNVAGFPLNVYKNTSFQQPILTDLDLDGKLDLVGSSFNFADPKDAYLFAWKTNLPYKTGSIALPMYQYNPQHDGLFVDYSIIVPVELSSFTGSLQGSSVTLNWCTATELNNKCFILSRDNKEITSITGQGTTSQKTNYSYTDKNVNTGNHTYSLRQIDFDGTYKNLGSVTIEVAAVPRVFTLSQNYPNPFNPSTIINCTIPQAGIYSLCVYDILGREVALIHKGLLTEGEHSFSFNAGNLSSGVYLYKLIGTHGSIAKKMILNK